MNLYKTIVDYVKTNYVVECACACKGWVTEKGEVRVEWDLKDDETEFYITLLHEFVHLDRGDHLKRLEGRHKEENENQVESLAIYLYHNNPYLVNFLRHKVRVSKYDYGQKAIS